MPEVKQKPRTLFRLAAVQNYFDPRSESALVWRGLGEMLRRLADTPGAVILGTMEDDQATAGASPSGWPCSACILADMPDRNSVVAACNLLRTIEVVWRRLRCYIRLEARIGRELAIPASFSG